MLELPQRPAVLLLHLSASRREDQRGAAQGALHAGHAGRASVFKLAWLARSVLGVPHTLATPGS